MLVCSQHRVEPHALVLPFSFAGTSPPPLGGLIPFLLVHAAYSPPPAGARCRRPSILATPPPSSAAGRGDRLGFNRRRQNGWRAPRRVARQVLSLQLSGHLETQIISTDKVVAWCCASSPSYVRPFSCPSLSSAPPLDLISLPICPHRQSLVSTDL